MHFEDDPMVVAQCVRVASDLGFRYRHRSHPDAHIVSVVSDDRPDAIIFDIHMPVMDGLTAATRLRKDHRFRTVPIVFYSSVDAATYAHKIRELDGTFFSKWSVTPKEVMLFLQQKLSHT